MQNIILKKEHLTGGTELLSEENGVYKIRFKAEGSGISLPALKSCRERYLCFEMAVRQSHSAAMNLAFYGQAADPDFYIRFGALPQVKAGFCFDLNWLDAHILFPEPEAGTLKLVCHGKRMEQGEIARAELQNAPAFHDLTVEISNLRLEDERPRACELEEAKLVDSLGQSKQKSWPGKTQNLQELKNKLLQQLSEKAAGYPFESWTPFGGWKEKKLTEGNGFFTRCKKDGRWWLVDPLGYAFFSIGTDCVGLGSDCRIDGVEKWLDWLPDRSDPVYGSMFVDYARERGEGHRKGQAFSYMKANLYRALGDGWEEKWPDMIIGQLKRSGMNTLGNWSDERILGSADMPYVTSLPAFPETEKMIFRDFPDVFDKAYEENARRCAKALEARRDDPLMIGYFLRNEPNWAFVDNLVLADEVLRNPQRTACKERLIGDLKAKYGEIAALNRAWNCSFSAFEDLYQTQKKVSERSEGAREDMRAFSRKMLRAYVEIPVRACREVDKNHMILGMRWAWISDLDLVSGWENFDVFSINCYAVDPTASIQNVVDLGVDLPVMIGEFHFGALDAGPSATGLEGVLTQKDRGDAFRYYVEKAASHPYGVGCHYFQCYDQFVLGRFDGENYNIGLFDVCSCPYEEMMEQVKACSRTLYQVASGEIAPVKKRAQSIPMVAY